MPKYEPGMDFEDYYVPARKEEPPPRDDSFGAFCFGVLLGVLLCHFAKIAIFSDHSLRW